MGLAGVFCAKKQEIENRPLLKDDIVDYDGHGNWGRFPPIKKQKEIIGDDYPTYEQLIKEYELQNSKQSAKRN